MAEYKSVMKQDPEMGVEHYRLFKHISWGAVFAGSFVALAIQATLSLFGMAVGVLSVPTSAAQLGSVGTGMETWLVVSTIISFFFGGLIAAWLSGYPNRLISSLHGVTVWGLVTVFTLSLATFAGGMYLGGVNGIVYRGVHLLLAGITDPTLQTQIMDITTRASIAAFIGTLLNLIASAVGGYYGMSKYVPVSVAAEVKEEIKREIPKAA